MKTLIILSLLSLSIAHGSESVGFYSSGSLLGAQSVFERGTPIQKLFIARGRLYTSDEMHKALTDASDFIKANYPNAEVLQVGDLSNKKGGEATGHASHQNGLDSDVVYLRKNGYVQSPDAKVWDEDFVTGNSPSQNFDIERNFSLFKYLVKTNPVSRIFVDVAIKKKLCSYANERGELKDPLTLETLRRLRPQDLHRTHFHLRISCPENDHECTPQSEPAKGSGCDDLSIILESMQNIHSC